MFVGHPRSLLTSGCPPSHSHRVEYLGCVDSHGSQDFPLAYPGFEGPRTSVGESALVVRDAVKVELHGMLRE